MTATHDLEDIQCLLHHTQYAVATETLLWQSDQAAKVMTGKHVFRHE